MFTEFIQWSEMLFQPLLTWRLHNLTVSDLTWLLSTLTAGLSKFVEPAFSTNSIKCFSKVHMAQKEIRNLSLSYFCRSQTMFLARVVVAHCVILSHRIAGTACPLHKRDNRYSSVVIRVISWTWFVYWACSTCGPTVWVFSRSHDIVE